MEVNEKNIYFLYQNGNKKCQGTFFKITSVLLLSWSLIKMQTVRFTNEIKEIFMELFVCVMCNPQKNVLRR